MPDGIIAFRHFILVHYYYILFLFIMYKIQNNIYRKDFIMTLKYPITMDYVDSLSGRDFEVFTKELLNTLGYKTAHVTPATHDHGLDVLYMNNQNQLVGVQDKHYGKDTKIGYDAIEDTDAGADYYNADKSVILTNCYFSKNALESSHTGKLDIQCWNRDILKELIDICNNILLNKIINHRLQKRFTYTIWNKDKTRCISADNLSYASFLLMNFICNNLLKYKHKVLYFKFKDLSTIVSHIILSDERKIDAPHYMLLYLKLNKAFTDLQYDVINHDIPYPLYSSVDINYSKGTITLKIADLFYKLFYHYLLTDSKH